MATLGTRIIIAMRGQRHAKPVIRQRHAVPAPVFFCLAIDVKALLRPHLASISKHAHVARVGSTPVIQKGTYGHAGAVARQRHRDSKAVVGGLAIHVTAQLNPGAAVKLEYTNMTRVHLRTSDVIQIRADGHATTVIRQRHRTTAEVNRSLPVDVRPHLHPRSRARDVFKHSNMTCVSTGPVILVGPDCHTTTIAGQRHG